ncbi:MAG TPA: hypothetical protein VKU35_03560 [Candidatus Limnocylindria bacterium]|nr:hypothetical protein [Candidatus Limnocylindria bacterium]
MTREYRERPPATGYRGSLPPRNDRLAAPWVATVVAVFVLVLALSVAGVPSKLFAAPSSNPSASAIPSGSAAPSGASGLPSASP